MTENPVDHAGADAGILELFHGALQKKVLRKSGSALTGPGFGDSRDIGNAKRMFSTKGRIPFTTRRAGICDRRTSFHRIESGVHLHGNQQREPDAARDGRGMKP
jgi:hypothetical protein